MIRRITIILAALIALAATASAQSMKPDAQTHFDAALAHYQAEEYAQAAAEFGKAHAIDPQVSTLFAWAQSERLAGNCKKAVELYQTLRKETLPDSDKLAVLEGLELCGRYDANTEPKPKPAAEPKPEPSPAPPPDPEPTPQPPPSGSPQRAEGSPWYADWVGDTLLVAGAFGVGIGASFWVISSSTADDAKNATTYDDHVDLEDSAQSKRTIAIVSLTAGTALIGGAVARYLMRGGGDSESAVAAGAWVGDGTTGFAIGGRF